MAKKRRQRNVYTEVGIGDLIHFCPGDLEQKYHEFGIVLDIKEAAYFYKRWNFDDGSHTKSKYTKSKSSKTEIEFVILWQGTNIISSYSADFINNSLIRKNIILIKSAP